MKHAIKSTKMMTVGLLTLCTMGFANATFATQQSGDPIEFKFVGKINNHPVFQLNLNNNIDEEFRVIIKDENSNVLYSEKVKGSAANFSRKYLLDIDEAELNSYGFGVRVEVTSLDTQKTQVYKITSHTSVNENIIVAQL